MSGIPLDVFAVYRSFLGDGFQLHKTVVMDNKKIIQFAGVVSGFTFLSRILGMVRDVLMAGFFGTSMAFSGFVIAFMIPNLFRRLFGEGALSAAFIPIFLETRKSEGETAAWLLARRVISMVAVTLTAISLVGVAVTGILLRELEPDTMPYVIAMLLQIMLPYMVFICLVALCMAILNSFHHFAVPAAATSLLNVVWIFALVVLCPILGDTMLEKIKVVAWAVLIAGILQLGMQIPMMRKHGYRVGFEIRLSDPKVKRVLFLMGPAALGLAVSQVNVVIDKSLAGWVGRWAPSCLFYSERLIYFPLGIFATALSTVLLPAFSGQAADLDSARYRKTIGDSLRTLMFIMVPSAIGLFALAEPIIQMIFQWGEFTEESTRLTAMSLQAYAPGLIVFSMGKVFVPAFYGLQDTRTPVLVGVGAVGLNLVMNLLAIWLWPVGTQHAGLALSTVLSSMVAVLILARLLDRRVGSPGWMPILRSLGRCLFLSLGMAVAAVVVQRKVYGVLEEAGVSLTWTEIIAVGVAIGVGAMLYVGASALLRVPEVHRVLQAVKRGRGEGPASD